MPFTIVRNDITKMKTEAVVNTANDQPVVGPGCDMAIYKAAGYDALLAYRRDKIGPVPEGEAFITPGFELEARYIIHAVSPLYQDGKKGEEDKLRLCYRNSLRLARDHHIRSIAFPLISTGSFGYPREEGMRIAVDEIHAFLLHDDMEIVLVVFGDEETSLGGRLYPGLEEYIDHHYVKRQMDEEYGRGFYQAADVVPYPDAAPGQVPDQYTNRAEYSGRRRFLSQSIFRRGEDRKSGKDGVSSARKDQYKEDVYEEDSYTDAGFDFYEHHEGRLEERMKHLEDTFSQYLMYLIQDKHMKNSDVYKRAIVDKKIFSKIKNNVNYHPHKLTALCLCMGARLNLDESRDLLARAGYALSPCDKTDIIFSYFIENEIYDMIELDIQLEEHGLPCIIS